MILLDEQMRADQRILLTRWRIRFRQIGLEIAPSGIKDENILPFLHALKHPTFFTHDQGFFDRQHVHLRYCLVWLDVSDIKAAEYIRSFLRHPLFKTHVRRMGTVARVHPGGIQFWSPHSAMLNKVGWDD